MAIHYDMRVEDDTLVVHASGFDESLAEVEEYGTAIIENCLKHGVRRVLCIERDLEYRLGTTDTYRAAEFMSYKAPKVSRSAVVCNPRYLAEARFWEDVAVNRGLTVRVFKDADAARQWLAQPATPNEPNV